MGHDDHGALAAKEVDEELKEGVDGECLRALSVNMRFSDAELGHHIPRRCRERDPKIEPP
jgi:hypothetical protein